MKIEGFMSRMGICAALVLALGCGQTGGDTEAGESGASTATSTGETTSGTTSSSSGSGMLTDGGGTAGQTESGTSTSSTGTTAATTGSGTTAGTSTGGDTSSTGPGTGSGGDLCGDFEEPGCLHKGCPNGQKCDTEVECVPSICTCDPMTGQVNCTPDCGGGTCVDPGACLPVPCDLFCENGFKTDEMGCEICECNDPPQPGCGCASDADCVKASPGCCSCNMGGTEVAIAKACIDQLEPCPFPPDEVVCPAVYKCTDMQAVCVNQQCVLK